MDSPSTEKEALEVLLKKVQGAPVPSSSGFSGAVFSDVTSLADLPAPDSRSSRTDLFRSVHLKVRVELGRVRLPLKEVLHLGPGSVVDLERLADDPVDIYVDDLLIARGEVLVVNDCFCVRVTEVFAQPELGEEAR